MMEKLKPCPFCGDKAKAIMGRPFIGGSGFVFEIRCSTCEFVSMTESTESNSLSFEELNDAMNNVVSRWNTRAEDEDQL